MLTDLEKTIICDRDEAIRDVTDKAKNDPTGFIRDWGSSRDLCDYECHLLDKEEAVYRAMRNAVDAIDGRAEAMLSEIRTASVRSVPRKISCFVHHDDKMAICRVYVNGEEFKGESVGFGRKNDTAALTNALNKSNAVLNILFNAVVSGKTFRRGVSNETIPEFCACDTYGDICEVFDILGYSNNSFNADGDICIVFRKEE